MADDTQAPPQAPESDGAKLWYEALKKLDRLAAVQPIVIAVLWDAETFGWESKAIEMLRTWLVEEEKA